MRPYMPSEMSLVYLGNLLVYSYLVNSSTKNSCKLVPISGSKTYAQIRGAFLCIPWIAFPLKSSDSDLQFCVKFLTQRRKGTQSYLFFCSYVTYIIAHGITLNFVFDKRTEEHIFLTQTAQTGAETLRLCVRQLHSARHSCKLVPISG